MTQHNVTDCPHNPTFDYIAKTFEHIDTTLERLDSHGERTAVALEQLARQSAIIANHETRINKHDDALKESFDRIRVIEARHNQEQGAEEVLEKQHKFWNQVKVQLAPYWVPIGLFLIYVVDRYNVGGFIAKMWKDMRG